MKRHSNRKRSYYIVENAFINEFRETMEDLKKSYSIRMPKRDEIIKEIISYIVQGDLHSYKVLSLNISIFRGDIKNFYPSINKHNLYQRISSNNSISKKSLLLIKKIIFNSSYSGVPLGLSFSNHLAEIYIESFDDTIKNDSNTVNYFRYVDDFIIIRYFDSSKEEFNATHSNLKNNLNSELSKLNLKLNENKSITTYLNNVKGEIKLNRDINFQYLGYQFKSQNGILKISISEKKIFKYKDRLNLYLKEFEKSSKTKKDFWELYYKFKNELFCITKIDKGGKVSKSGLAYYYRFVNEQSEISNFISYFIKKIYFLPLSSYQKYMLVSLFRDSNGQTFMKKKFNYLKLTSNQKKIISSRLGITSSYNLKFVVNIFVKLYDKV